VRRCARMVVAQTYDPAELMRAIGSSAAGSNQQVYGVSSEERRGSHILVLKRTTCDCSRGSSRSECDILDCTDIKCH